MRKRSELITHIQNTVSQYNLPPLEHRIQKRCEREGLLSHFPDPQVRNSIALDLAMIEQYDALLPKLERHIRACAKEHDRKAFTLLRSIHGADLILPLVILYEIHTIGRFPRMQDFLSYCRLVKPARESAGKLLGHAGGKIGNAHLKWAFSELATTFLRANPGARQGSCRLIHAASGCVSMHSERVLMMESRSGLSVTAPMGDQLRVVRDQRAGLRSRALVYSA